MSEEMPPYFDKKEKSNVIAIVEKIGTHTPPAIYDIDAAMSVF